MTNAIFNFQSQAGAIPVFSRKYHNNGRHVCATNDVIDFFVDDYFRLFSA